MPSIDERVVAMAFENAKFEAGVAKTMTTLAKLDTAIKSIGSSSGLDNIEKAANKVTLQGPMSALDKLKSRLGGAGQGAAEGFNEIEKAGNKVQLEQPMSVLDRLRARLGNVGANAADGMNEIEKASNRVELRGLNAAMDSVTAKFSVIQGAATVAFGNITSQAAMKGASFAKSFSFGPIQQGFQEYQTNLGSIQTIMANTEGQRVSGLKETNKHLNELNRYSDKTIYNFSQMAKNIGTFTAAGVDLDTSTQSIKGIANLAALSGSSAEQASTAMYQLSQAIASGRVGLQDWNSVVNAGMGGRKFQNSLIQTGVAMGTIEKGAVKIDKATGKATINGQSFRESIMAAPGKQSWLSSEVLTSSLSQFTGDMTDAELAAKGFSQEQIKSIQATAKSAQNAATQVKTLPQVFDVAREAIGSGWAQTFSNIFGNFTESKKLFTGLSNSINGIINQNAKARNKMLAEWKKGGGRVDLIEGIKAGFQAIAAFLKPIKDAFRDIFPAKTASDLLTMTKHFRTFMENLKPSAEVVDGLRRTFRGLFAVLHIVWAVIKGVIGVIGDLLGVVGKGSGSFLDFTGSIGDFLTKVDEVLTKGGVLKSFFETLSGILRIPLEILSNLGSAFAGLFSDDQVSKVGQAGDTVKSFGDKVQPLEAIFDKIKEAIKKTIVVVNKFFAPFSNFISGIGKAFANIGTTIGNAIGGGNLEPLIKILNTAFLGGIFLALKKFLGEGTLLMVNPLKQVGAALGGLTGVLQNMQHALKAGIILAIATAVLALAGGVKLMSSIDPKALTRAMSAVAIGLGELVGAIGILQGMAKGGGAVSLAATSAAMVALAGSLVILAGAMKIFATMSWDELQKGLLGVGGSLTAVGLGVKGIGPSITLIAPGILGVALALNMLAVAMKLFGEMKFGDIVKGLVAVGGSLYAIGVGIEGLGPSLLLVGPGLIAAGFGLSIIAAAVGSFGKMDPKTLVTGILGMGTALAVLAAALWEMPPGPMLIAQAAGLTLAGIALTGIGAAIKLMGSMSIEQMAKGLITLGAALFELAVGLDIMSSTIPGAAALLLAATALGVLTPVIAILGTLSWGTIIKGLVAIGGALAVLGLVGGLAAPGIAVLATALTLLGLAVITIGAGVYLIVKALILLGDSTVKSTGILIAAITAFIVAIPKMVIEFLKGVVEIIKSVAELAPKVVDSLTKILNALIQVVENSTPKLAEAIGTLVDGILQVIVRDSPKLIRAGITLILNLLKGIDQNISQVVSRVGSIITKFLNGLADKAPDLVAAGARVLAAFLNGIADHIVDVVKAAGRVVANFLGGIALAIPGIVKQALHIIANFINGIANNLWQIRKAAVNLAGKFLDNLAKALLKITGRAADAVIDFVNGIAKTIHEKAPELRHAFLNLAYEMADAFSFGLVGKAGKILEAFQYALKGEEDPAEVKRQQDENIRNAAKADKAYARAHHGRSRYSTTPEQRSASVRGKVAAEPPVEPEDALTPEKDTSGKFVPVGKRLMANVAVGIKKELPATKAVVSQALQSVFDVMHRETPPGKFEFLTKNIKRDLTLGLVGLSSVLQSGVTVPIHALLAQNKDLRAFGQFLGGEFRQGLTGGLWNDGKSDARKQIEASFNALKAKLGEEHQKLRDSVKSDQDALKQELKAKDKDWGKIEGLRARIAQERTILAQSKAASKDLLRGMAGEQSILIKLAAKYEEVAAKLQTAKDKLNSLKDDRKQAIQQYSDQFSALPDIGQLLDSAMSDAAMTWAEKWDAQRQKQEDDQKRRAIDQVANYKKALQDQIAATIKYNETLNKLRALGLDDVTYKKLLDMGTAGQEFASQLLQQGKPAVDSINALDSQLGTAAGDIGKSAAHSLYDAAIQAAKGFVDGFKAQEAEIRKLMTGIAKSMVTALKTALGIKSPSRVFAELGQFTTQGLADGLAASSNLVQDAAAGLGDDAAAAMTDSLANIADRVQNGINTDVTITPVLDLSQVQKDASKIQDLSNVVPITAAASYGQASAISEETQAAREDAAAAADKATIEVNLEQNNTSPKALDDVEIYRNTRNQLSQVKSALGLVSQPTA